ncbi:MAG TPA: hypothetical protein VGO56_05770 [Pyrinomonadaceae bacterium]|jgi:uncharacterized repeat protein (TIGR01451 family)|nr:hypothetical protein [Pyrinomonadaceae bacterium]
MLKLTFKNCLALISVVPHRLLPLALVGITLIGCSQVALAITPGGGAVADLSISKSADESVQRGRELTYSINVTNEGPDSATGVTVTDVLPPHTSFVSAMASQGTVMNASNTVTANLGTIAIFEGASVTIVVAIDADTPRETIINNTATVTSGSTDPNPENNSATASTAVTGPFAGDLVISEFRLRGPGVGKQQNRIKGAGNSASDEFIEIYNNTGGTHFVSATDASAGYSVAASDGVVRCTIPNGTVIPAGGHYLCVNSVGYSLASYPAASNTTATGDTSYTADIPDNAGIALFSSASTLTLANRLDAVGSTTEANTLYKEGTGYPAVTTNNIDYSFYRDNCGRQGSVASLQPCTITTGVIDTNNNATDFIFVDTNGTSAGAGQRLGAPGPENLSSPRENNAGYAVTLLDPCAGGSAAPNQVRDLTADAGNNSTLGTIELRRTIINNSAGPATRLRFRVTQQTTFPAPSGTADLRLRTSPDLEVTVDRAPCGDTTSDITVHGTTLEQPPNQPNGGGFNSTVSANAVGPGIVGRPGVAPTGVQGVPLNLGEGIDLRFLYGVQQTGKFRITLNIEVLESAPVEEERVENESKPTAAPVQKKPR